MSKTPKKTKKQGPFRSGAIISIFIFSLLTFGYFYFFFDNHLKSVAQWTATQVYGAEVNISNLNIDFLEAKLQLRGLQVTNKSNPKENLFEIENIEFQMLWDALLRAKIVVETTRVQGVALYTTRRSAGRIIPKSERNKGPAKALNDPVPMLSEPPLLVAGSGSVLLRQNHVVDVQIARRQTPAIGDRVVGDAGQLER